MSNHAFSLEPEQQMMLAVMFQGTLYYRDIDQFTHRRLDALLPKFQNTPSAYVLLTLNYTAERVGRYPLADQVLVTSISCQDCSAEKTFQILNSKKVTLAEKGSGKYEAIMSLYQDYLSIGRTVHVDWWSELNQEEAES